MSLRMWIAAGSMMLMWGSQTYANGALSDTLEKSSIINFSVNVKAPVCRISVPDSVDFGEHDVNGIRNNIEKKFAIRLESCNQQIPHPKIIFGGEYIDASKNYIKNKAGIEYAGGVGIFILFNGDVIKLQEDINLDGVNENEINDFEFTARISPIDTITPGIIDASASINLIYY